MSPFWNLVIIKGFQMHSCSNHLNLEMEAECLTTLSYLNLNISRTKNGRIMKSYRTY